MPVTRRHAKYMQNYEYLNWARIMHGMTAGKRFSMCCFLHLLRVFMVKYNKVQVLDLDKIKFKFFCSLVV